MMWQPDLLRSSCRQRRYVPHRYLDPYHRVWQKPGSWKVAVPQRIGTGAMSLRRTIPGLQWIQIPFM
jgi:hypothetical protein